MSLKEKISIYDRNFKGVEGDPVGQNPPGDGNYFTDKGNSPSPFESRGDDPDHLKALLKNQIVNSAISGLTYDPNQMTGNQPEPNNAIDTYPDFNGLQGPQFQRDTETASQVHKSSLSLVPGPPSNSPFQDLNVGDGTPSQYIDNLPI